ncbi:MAG: cache domain-containing protein, partial [Firmicutes bacterium]|nr:cache domain-containing protein [Bacillota bacterium]
MPREHWFFQKKWRLLATVLFVVLLPVFCLDIFVYLGAFKTLRQKIDHENYTVAHMAAGSIEGAIATLISYGQGRASGPGLIEAIKKKDEAFVRRVMKSIAENSTDITRAYLTTPEGVCWVDYPVDPEAKGRDSSGRDWYKGVSREWQPYVSELYLRYTAPREYLIAVAVPVKEEGRVLGILVLQVNMQSVFRALNFKVGEGYLYLVDQKGVLIYHPQKQIDRKIDYSAVPAVSRVMQKR